MENNDTAMNSFVAKNQELHGLITHHRANPDCPLLSQRINAFVLQKKGKKMIEYMNNGSPITEKMAMLDEIISILKTEEWYKLPQAPAGQAPGAVPPTTSTPLVKPEKLTPLPTLPPSAPKAEAPAPAKADPAPAVITIPECDDQVTQIAAMLAKLVKPAPAAPPANILTEERVRKIVADETRRQIIAAIEQILVLIKSEG